MNDDKHDDDNPWDDDDGARTLATDGPSFEMPSNIPSPITVPPPAPAPPKNPAKATLVGLMPADFLAIIAAAPPLSGPTTPRSPPRPVTIPDDALDDLPGQQDDGPTMLGAGSSPNIPLRDDAAPPGGFGGFAPMHRHTDADAETMALDREDSRLPDLSDEPDEPEDATRALTREQMMGTPSGGHQDAHVVVGSDARGDEATLAIGPDQLSPALGALGAPLEPALAEALAQRVAEHHQHIQQQAHQQQLSPHFPQPPHPAHPAPQQQQFAPHHAHQAAYALQQPATQPVAYPPSGQHPMMGPPQSQPLPQSQPVPWGAPPTFAPQSSPQPAPWMPSPQPPAAEALGAFGFRSRSQVMVLAGVGVVCLAIFVIGLVLFFTTKF